MKVKIEIEIERTKMLDSELERLLRFLKWVEQNEDGIFTVQIKEFVI
jgi:hypothetical protein